jgi:hypothetical protein
LASEIEEGWVNNYSVNPQGITAERMILQLAGVCNGASTWDGAGFSKMDTNFGHSLAQRAQQGRAWSEKQAAAALKLINKYRKQLGGDAVIQEWLCAPVFAQQPLGTPAPLEGKAAQADRKLTSKDQTAVFSFSFNRELVDAIKAIRGEHKGKKFWAGWDAGSKTWSVPVNESSIVLIMNVALAWEFDIEERFVVFHRRVLDKLMGVTEAAESSKVAEIMGHTPGVDLQAGKLVIAHADPQILAQFEAALAAL